MSHADYPIPRASRLFSCASDSPVSAAFYKTVPFLSFNWIDLNVSSSVVVVLSTSAQWQRSQAHDRGAVPGQSSTALQERARHEALPRALHNPTEEEEIMRIQLFMKQVVLIGCLMASAVLPTGEGQAADLRTMESAAPIAMGEMNVMASGAVEDTLKLCLARIPQDASVGQLLLAEQSCQGAERTRSTSQGASQY